MSIITVQNLKKKYGKVKALQGVSFEVSEGEIYGLLGPNGAGKTTTIEILEGLNKSDSGKVTILGKEVDHNNNDTREKIGVVLQESNFLPHLSLLELFRLFASFYKESENIDHLADRFELGNLLDRTYHKLSGGQRQRFTLALALVHKPKVLFLDEPTLGLDPAVRQRFWETILDLRKNGLTILMSTHYMEEAEVLCDRVGIIDHGQILLSDKPVKLVNSLGVSSKIKFMSSKPLNLDKLSEIRGVTSAKKNRYSYDLETEKPEASLRELLEWEKKFSGKIFNLQVRQATLEDVFLKLTGHSIRDD